MRQLIDHEGGAVAGSARVGLRNARSARGRVGLWARVDEYTSTPHPPT